MSTFLNEADFAQLVANGQTSRSDAHFDPQPVVKLFTPDDGATWLLTEIDPDNLDRAFVSGDTTN